MRQNLTILFSLFFFFTGFSQSGNFISQKIAAYHASNIVFQQKNAVLDAEVFVPNLAKQENNVLDKATLLHVGFGELANIIETSSEAIEMTIPLANQKDITVELVKVNVFTSDFTATDAETGEPISFDAGVYYQGIIKGDEHSLVSIAFLPNEMMGFVSSDFTGNLVIGKKEGSFDQTEHLIYADRDLKVAPGTICEMNDDLYEVKESSPAAQDRATGDCTGLWIECDRDVASAKGGTTNAATWITGVFSQVITLYANEQMEVGIHHLEIWPSGNTNQYKGTSSSACLSKFKAGRASSFTGNLAILCNMKSSYGGVAAGFAGICNSNRANSMSYAGLQSSYNSVPTYSWTIMVCTHELGHLFGSRHTHACVWNGNNTAIDGCQTVEGTCSRPGYPSGGGTIMSYCHIQSVGINFNNGFGPQPGAVIRNTIANASCLSANCTSGRPAGERNEIVTKLSVQPNPVSGEQLLVNFNNPSENESSILIMDVLGNVVMVRNLGTLTEGNHQATLEVGKLTTGYYFLLLQTGDSRNSLKFVKSVQ